MNDLKLIESDKVKQLFDTPSKWDVVVKGQTIKLKLSPCRCGVEARWVYSIPVVLPDEIKHLLGDKRTVEKTLMEWHFEPTWWQRYLLFHRLKPKLAAWIKDTHRDLVRLRESEDSMDGLSKFVEDLS